MSENSEGLAGGNGKALGTDHAGASIDPENRLTAPDTQEWRTIAVAPDYEISEYGDDRAGGAP